MKTVLALLLAATPCFAEPDLAGAPDAAPAPAAESRAEVRLVDGSLLKGAVRQRFLPAVSPNVGRIRLDLSSVESIAFDKPGAPAKIAFRNGDTLTVSFPADRAFVGMDTIVGRVKLPFDKVSSLAIEPAGNRESRIPRSALLYHCTFDSAEAIELPAAGPNGTFLGGTFEGGKKDKALRVRKGLSSAIVPFEKGILGPRGTIEFWAKIANDREVFSDGGDPRFFMLVTSPGSETLLQFAANDGCGHGGLSAYHQRMNLASKDHYRFQMPYSSVLPEGTTKDWHHYALVRDEDGVPGSDTFESVAVFVDGKRIRMFGDTGPVNAHRMASRFRDNPATLFFSLNPELNRGFNNKTDFLIDEFKIWSAPKTVFDIR